MVEDDSKFEQVGHFEEQRLLEREEALNFINSCLTDVGRFGANDAEPGLLQELLSKLEKGEIDPLSSRAKAASIVARKNDYH